MIEFILFTVYVAAVLFMIAYREQDGDEWSKEDFVVTAIVTLCWLPALVWYSIHWAIKADEWGGCR